MASEDDVHAPAAADVAPCHEAGAEAGVRAAWRSCFEDMAQAAKEPDALRLAQAIAAQLRARSEGNVRHGPFRLHRILTAPAADPADAATAQAAAGSANVYPLRRR